MFGQRLPGCLHSTDIRKTALEPFHVKPVTPKSHYSGLPQLTTLVVLGGLSVLFIIIVILFLADDIDNPDSMMDLRLSSETRRKPLPVTTGHFDNTLDTHGPHDRKPPPISPTQTPNQDNPRPLGFGDLYEQKKADDLKKLGTELFSQMEDLWLRGRRPRGSTESIEHLENLLSRFPQTNRAGCAAFELGHHQLRNTTLNPVERLRKAEYYWRLTENHYQDSVCEYNFHAAANAKLSMAAWIYRHKDSALARRILEEIIGMHPNETDHLGQSLQKTAKKLLDQLN